MLHKIQKEFWDLLRAQVKVAKDGHRAYSDTPEVRYALPDDKLVDNCWHSLAKLYRGEYSADFGFAGLNSVSGIGKLGIYIMYGTLLYNKANASFPMEAVIRVLNYQLEKQTGKGLAESDLLAIDREVHKRAGDALGQLHYLYDSFAARLK